MRGVLRSLGNYRIFEAPYFIHRNHKRFWGTPRDHRTLMRT